MILAQHTIDRYKHCLSLLFMTFDKNKKLSPELTLRLKDCEQKLANGTIEESAFEHFINELIFGFDEHMVIWKMLADSSLSQFLKRGPVLLFLLAAPDIKTCIDDITNNQYLFLPDDFSLTFYREGEKIILQIEDKGIESELPHIKQDTAIAFSLLIFREIAGSEFDYEELYIPENRPFLDKSIIHQVTHAIIKTSAGPMRASFNGEWISSKNPVYDKQLHTQIRLRLNQLKNELKNRPSFAGTLSKIIKRSAQPGNITLARISEILGETESIIRRKLAKENISFNLLYDKVIDEICMDALLTSDIKIETLALKLGYVEHLEFKRSINEKFGAPPEKFRRFRENISDSTQTGDINNIVNQLQPLPRSCIELIQKADEQSLNLNEVTTILEKDPVFAGRVMGLASKSFYGTTPSNLAQAVGRNLGIETVKNLAILFAAQSCFGDNYENFSGERFINAISCCPRIFQLLTRNYKGLEFDSNLVAQTLSFGLLGMLILSHKAFSNHREIIKLFEDAKCFREFMLALKDSHNPSVLSASVLLLSYWGLNSEVIRTLSETDRKISENQTLSILEGMCIFTFTCCFALAYPQDNFEDLKLEAEYLCIKNFEDKWAHLLAGF